MPAFAGMTIGGGLFDAGGFRGGAPRRGGGVGLGDGLAAKRTFVGRSPRPCERAELAEPRPKTGGFFPLL